MEVLSRATWQCNILQASLRQQHQQAPRARPIPVASLSLLSSSWAPASLALSSILSSSWAPASLALSFNDAPDSLYSDSADFFIDFDAATDFMTANPVAFLAGLAAVGVPLIVFTVLATPQTFGSVSAVDAFASLGKNPNAELLDIRGDVKLEGSPNLKSVKKKAVQVVYGVSDEEDFVAKVVAKCKNPEATTLFILDRVDGNSLAVAKLLADNGLEGAFAIKGGVEGPNGWKENELPWSPPRKGILDGLKDILNGTDSSSIVPTTIGAAAAAGIGAAFFTEAESLLQLLGSVAIIQIVAKKFLFAKDREKTIKELSIFLDTKVAPKDLTDDLKEVGKVLLPNGGEGKAAVTEKKPKVESVTKEAVVGKVA